MNSPTLNAPPELEPPLSGNPDAWHPLVAVRLAILFPVPSYFPAGNYIGTTLLARAFTDELDGENLSVKDIEVFAGHLNDSWFLFEVANATRALELLEAVLNRLHLRGFASLLFYHTKLRLFQPHGFDGAHVARRFTLEEMHAALSRVKSEHSAILIAMKAFRASLAKPAQPSADSPTETPPPTPPADPAQ